MPPPREDDDSMDDFIDDSEGATAKPAGKRATHFNYKRNTGDGSSRSTVSKKRAAVLNRSDSLLRSLMATHFASSGSSSGEDADGSMRADSGPAGRSDEDDIGMAELDAAMSSEAGVAQPPRAWETNSQLSSMVELQADVLEAINWDEDVEEPDRTMDIPMDVSSAHPVQPPEQLRVKSGDTTVHMWWFDACERADGVVTLFGKAHFNGKWITAAVSVHGMLRNVFIEPAADSLSDEETLEAVRTELAELTGSHGIPRFGCKLTERNRFAMDGRQGRRFVKMVYEYAFPALPADLAGRSFRTCHGTHQSALEHFVLKRRLMGPCWLRIDECSAVLRGRLTTATVEWETDDMHSVHAVDDPVQPPLTQGALSLRTVFTKASVHDAHGHHEIVQASLLLLSAEGTPTRSVDLLRPLHGGCTASAGCAVVKTEADLLLQLFRHLHELDVLIGHDSQGFLVTVLQQRIRALRLHKQCLLSRVSASSGRIHGRLVVDTYLSAREFVRAKSYSMECLAETVLGRPRQALDLTSVASYLSRSSSAAWLVRHSAWDAYLASLLCLSLQVLPLTLQLTRLAGSLWQRTLSGGNRAERNEWLLLHEFFALKYLLPDKPQFKAGDDDESSHDEDAEDDDQRRKPSARRKPAYTGGLVLEPKRGFYDRLVLLLDFQSLYPSIIQEYNICFTTPASTCGEPATAPQSEAGGKQGVLPAILASLVAKRRSIKAQMKSAGSAEQMSAWNIQQQALKLTANSMYGCLGFTHSRFYAKPLAEAITARGREILTSTAALAQELAAAAGGEGGVIYGDTDSVMIYTATEQVEAALALGAKIKAAVRQRYRLLEMEVDGVFGRLLLLRKKKYAALVIENYGAVAGEGAPPQTRIESKGLDLVRRDWCPLAGEVSRFILEHMMAESAGCGAPLADVIHDQLRMLSASLVAMPVSKFVINKSLTKEPEAYADPRSQPHVMVALGMRARGMPVQVGTTIPYVITADGHGGGRRAISERAIHPDGCVSTKQLDLLWYLQQQLHPVISRLCEFVPGMSGESVAQALGLDSRRYRSHAAGSSSALVPRRPLYTRLTLKERFREIEPVTWECQRCCHAVPFPALAELSKGALVSHLQCPQCQHCVSPDELQRSFEALVSKHARLAAQTQWQCTGCHAVCAAPAHSCEAPSSTTTPIIPPEALYHRLLYYRHLLDTEPIRQALVVEGDAEKTEALKAANASAEPSRCYLSAQIDACAYGTVRLGADVFPAGHYSVVGEKYADPLLVRRTLYGIAGAVVASQ